ncbi:TetR/AcrR family transcriptional regulator [Gymnodinialimonas sp.]
MTGSTRTAILDSAERAARARGFDGFSYAVLSQEVGIRKASIHYHFPTKAALASALIARYHDEMARTCRQIDLKCETGGSRVHAMLNVYRVALNDGQSLCLCVALSVSRESLPDDLPESLAAFRAMVIDWLAAAFSSSQTDGSIANVQDVQAEAAAALALLEGAQLAARATENVAQFDTAVALLRARLSA